MFSQASHNSRLTAVAPASGSGETIARVTELIASIRPDDVDLLAACHSIQHEFGYVPREAVPLLAEKLNTTPALIFGAIDFYSELRTDPPAEEVVEWCSGPACLLKGSMGIRRSLESILSCRMQGQTEDGRFELRLVQCDGTCHLAPLIRHRGRYIGPLSASAAVDWARRLKGPAGSAPAGGADAENPSEAADSDTPPVQTEEPE